MHHHAAPCSTMQHTMQQPALTPNSPSPPQRILQLHARAPLEQHAQRASAVGGRRQHQRAAAARGPGVGHRAGGEKFTHRGDLGGGGVHGGRDGLDRMG